ncbi:MAG TPA: AmmeMemoRadiSam system radical SAM enzyme [Candidatus Sulfomarinibacteraceae bacterium]|nr:AmmeMemoRadiSam system radical SAM enzyme [Candidatus Sulfomarinibacteraceae bacterium]
MTLDRRRFAALLAGSAAAGVAGRGLAGVSLRPGAVVDGGELPAREASWYRKLEENRVECGLCPQACKVADAERGTCGVRENRRGTYVTLVHSLACSVHADPIEKKPFSHVMPGELALSYAAAGCNVECKFCQNWEISQFRPEQVRATYLPPEALVSLARRAGARLTAATYSEPVVFWEYVRDAAEAARKAGLAPTVVTNGYIQKEPLAEVLPLLRAVKVDLKSFREEFYERQVRGRLRPVLDALEVIRASGVWLEIVVLLIPTLNDSEAEVRDLARWVKATLGVDVPVHFTRFHPTYRLTDLPPTPVATLERAWNVARAEGLDFVYLGNVPGHPGESTRCPGCGGVLVKRLGFTVLDNRLVDGACPDCHRTIPGVWA